MGWSAPTLTSIPRCALMRHSEPRQWEGLMREIPVVFGIAWANAVSLLSGACFGQTVEPPNKQLETFLSSLPQEPLVRPENFGIITFTEPLPPGSISSAARE